MESDWPQNTLERDRQKNAGLPHQGGYAIPAYDQGGAGLLTLVVLAAVIGFVALVIIKLAPVYMENFQVRSVLQSLTQEPEITRATRTEVHKLVMRRFDVNDIRNVPPKAVRVKTQPGHVEVGIVYEVRVPLIANLDVVAKFNDSVEAGAR